MLSQLYSVIVLTVTTSLLIYSLGHMWPNMGGWAVDEISICLQPLTVIVKNIYFIWFQNGDRLVL